MHNREGKDYKDSWLPSPVEMDRVVEQEDAAGNFSAQYYQDYQECSAAVPGTLTPEDLLMVLFPNRNRGGANQNKQS